MKISKLFHWLYGILMLLPILVFIPNAFYYGFNEQAVAQEKTEQVPVYYETNIISSLNDFVIDHVYNWKDSVNVVTQQTRLDLLRIKVLSGTYENLITSLSLATSGNVFIVFNGDAVVINDIQFDFLLMDYNTNFESMPDYVKRGFTYCNNQYLKQINTLTTTMSITDSMSYAWDSVWQNVLFSWSYESFLAEPFKYIGNVFGLPNDNSIYYCLSYWLDISIIWLCFDLIMYVPLLVHRWIDKGILE